MGGGTPAEGAHKGAPSEKKIPIILKHSKCLSNLHSLIYPF